MSEIRTQGLLLLFLTALALYFWLAIAANGARIDTDLKSLSPSLKQADVVNRALDEVANNASTTVTLLLSSPDEYQLEDASLLLEELIEQTNPPIEYLDRADLLDEYVTTLAQHPYHLLTKDAQQALRESSDRQILAAVQRRLYGHGGMVRLIPVNQDPFGYTNEFAVTAAERITASAAAQSPQTSRPDEQLFKAIHTLRLPTNSLEMQAQQESVETIEQLLSQLTAKFPTLEVARSGVVFYAADAAQSAKADIGLISTGSSLAIIVLVLAVFRQLSALVLPIASIALGSLFAFALCHAYFGAVHILTVVFGASLIGVVIDYCLHYFYLYQQDNPSSQQHLHKALFLSLTTSIIGYGALSVSGLEALQQISLFSALGLIYAWLFVVCMGPMFAKHLVLHDSVLRIAVSRLMTGLTALPNALLPLCVLSALACLALITKLDFPSNDSPKAFIKVKPEIAAQEKQVAAASTRYEPASFILIKGNSDQEVFDRIHSLHEATRGLDNVLLDIQTLLPSPAEQKRNFELNSRLYGADGLVEQLMRDGPLSSLNSNTYQQRYREQSGHWLQPSELIERLQGHLPPLWIEEEGHIYAFVLIGQGTNMQQLRLAVEPLSQVEIVSAVDEASSALRDLRIAALQLLAAGVCIIALIMIGRFGWKLGARLMLIPCGALVFTLLLLSFFGIKLTLFHVMALFLVLGLGMDYVIFAAEIKHQHTLCAIVLSAATSLLSFGLLSLSSLPAVNAFGVTVLVGNTLNLLGCVILSSRLASPFHHP